ncbi:MAG: hypothetical protein IPJ43_11005 [Saprospiraceae bacterium]|nr:hypothetical protein [Saprospiraceae bacterium]
MHIYKSSELLLLEALDVQLKLNGMIHFQYVDLLIRLAKVNALGDNNDRAELFYLQAKIIAEKVFRIGSPAMTRINFSLANFYLATGVYEKAEKLLLEVKENVKLDTENVDVSYSSILIKLGDLYYKTNRKQCAELSYIEAKNGFKVAEGENSINYNFALSCLANYYRLIGNYEAAISIFNECQKIFDN